VGVSQKGKASALKAAQHYVQLNREMSYLQGDIVCIK